ncbi:hypothetical protein Tco_0247194 [Tanacetum coccineum]
MKLIQFLMSLDDTYMQIRSSILSGETLPDVRIAYATISSEESHKVITFGSRSRTSQRPNNANNNRQGGWSGLGCENYGFNVHTIESSSSGFTNEQLFALISLIKDNSINGEICKLIW